ncbi:MULTISPECIES: hypothetical protein [unclassified Methanoregula]|nr:MULTISPECIES: hypothetical protein [unclassified Methanoregula]
MDPRILPALLVLALLLLFAGCVSPDPAPAAGTCVKNVRRRTVPPRQ